MNIDVRILTNFQQAKSNNVQKKIIPHDQVGFTLVMEGRFNI